MFTTPVTPPETTFLVLAWSYVGSSIVTSGDVDTTGAANAGRITLFRIHRISGAPKSDVWAQRRTHSPHHTKLHADTHGSQSAISSNKWFVQEESESAVLCITEF